MKTENLLDDFIKLGHFLQQFTADGVKDENLSLNANFYDNFKQLLLDISHYNTWFTTENVRKSLFGISNFLNENKLKKWLQNYKIQENNPPKRVGVVLAGNIPLVGFHDFLCVLISNNIFIGKLSSKDDKLLKAIIEILTFINPQFANRIYLQEEHFTKIDAIIATGSNNSARYFEYYFSKYPNIIRKNRNSIAVLTGRETQNELQLLADDIFMYFGLGCRNVSKIYVPENYDMTRLINALEKYKYVINHHKYANNYDYHKSIYLLNRNSFLDNEFAMFIENKGLNSPISVLFYEKYSDLLKVKEEIDLIKEQIQCIVTKSDLFPEKVYFGKSQEPELWDYSDHIDTLEFLIGLA